MGEKQNQSLHAAEAAALGFYYQAHYALLTLLAHDTDNAAVGIEQLDDVELRADGHTLLYQLKHSMLVVPPSITLKSSSLWRTVKVWIDILPNLSLSETTFHLVAAGSIPSDSPLMALADFDSERYQLVRAMQDEAQRVVNAQDAAAKAKKPLPYADRAPGCRAFLSLGDSQRLGLLRRAIIKKDSPNIVEIEGRIADQMKILPVDQRSTVAKRLVEWWDRQIIYSLCHMRERVVLRVELQQQISAIIADIEQGKLMPDFETINPPEEYQPDGMLARQIKLVEGRSSDYSRAIREEWRAREQRSKWLNDNPAMATKINDYDQVLVEHWSDRHGQMVEDCAEMEKKEKCASGLKILRWTHEDAPNVVRPITEGWSAAYYVRGSYQVLAINLSVGWHPEYNILLWSPE